MIKYIINKSTFESRITNISSIGLFSSRIPVIIGTHYNPRLNQSRKTVILVNDKRVYIDIDSASPYLLYTNHTNTNNNYTLTNNHYLDPFSSFLTYMRPTYPIDFYYSLSNKELEKECSKLTKMKKKNRQKRSDLDNDDKICDSVYEQIINIILERTKNGGEECIQRHSNIPEGFNTTDLFDQYFAQFITQSLKQKGRIDPNITSEQLINSFIHGNGTIKIRNDGRFIYAFIKRLIEYHYIIDDKHKWGIAKRVFVDIDGNQIEEDISHQNRISKKTKQEIDEIFKRP